MQLLHSQRLRRTLPPPQWSAKRITKEKRRIEVKRKKEPKRSITSGRPASTQRTPKGRPSAHVGRTRRNRSSWGPVRGCQRPTSYRHYARQDDGKEFQGKPDHHAFAILCPSKEIRQRTYPGTPKTKSQSGTIHLLPDEDGGGYSPSLPLNLQRKGHGGFRFNETSRSVFASAHQLLQPDRAAPIPRRIRHQEKV